MIPEGFEARPATAADAAEATAVVNALNHAQVGDDFDEETAQDTLDWWAGTDAAKDTLLLHETATGRLAALGVLDRRDVLDLDGYVRPDLTGHGLGSALASWAEEQARERGFARVRGAHLASDEAAARLFRGRGYEYVRSFYRMVLDLDAPPAPPEWPAGCEVESLEPGGEHDFYVTTEESFADHWGRVDRPFDEWIERTRAMEPDPALWFLAREGGEPAAAALCAQRFGLGWIGSIGVRPAWRRRGLARALLLHAFGELYARGERRMGLGVDASNETGATRLYESVGMRVSWRADIVELTL